MDKTAPLDSGEEPRPTGRAKPRPYVLATKMFVDVVASDLHDPKNQGPNFDERTFPIGALTAAFFRGDEVIGATETELEHAKSLACEVWAKAWGIDPDELEPDSLDNLGGLSESPGMEEPRTHLKRDG